MTSAVATVTGSAADATGPPGVVAVAAAAWTAGARPPALALRPSPRTALAGTARPDPTIGVSTSDHHRKDQAVAVPSVALLGAAEAEVAAVLLVVAVAVWVGEVSAAAVAVVVAVVALARGSAADRWRTAAACSPRGTTRPRVPSDRQHPIHRIVSRKGQIRVNNRQTHRINKDGTSGPAGGVAGATGTRTKVGATGVTGAIGATSRAQSPGSRAAGGPRARVRAASRASRANSSSSRTNNNSSSGPATTPHSSGTSGSSGSNSNKAGRGTSKGLSKGTLRTRKRGLNITRTTAVQTQATLEETRPSTTRSDPGRNHTAQHNTNTSRCVRYLQERDTPLWPAHTNRNIFFYISFNRCVYIEKLIKLVHTTSVILKSYSNLLLPRIQVLHNQSSKLTTMLHSTTITCIELVNI